MANNSIGAYAQGGSNDIGAYEKVSTSAITRSPDADSVSLTGYAVAATQEAFITVPGIFPGILVSACRAIPAIPPALIGVS